MGTPSPKSFEDKRTSRRIDVRIPVGIYPKGKNHVVDAEIVNISEGGAFVVCSMPIEIGQEVNIEIRFKGAKLFGGKVVDHEEIDAELPSQTPETSIVRWKQTSNPPGFGIQFDSLQGDKKEFLEKLMHYYDLLNKAGVTFTK